MYQYICCGLYMKICWVYRCIGVVRQRNGFLSTTCTHTAVERVEKSPEIIGGKSVCSEVDFCALLHDPQTSLVHTTRGRSIELTIVKINKSWNMQQVENTPNTRFLLALQCYKARTKHAHTPHSSEHARRCTFSVHRSYIQLIPIHSYTTVTLPRQQTFGRRYNLRHQQ